MPHDVSGTSETSLLELGNLLHTLLLAADQGRWDDLASITAEAQPVLERYTASTAQNTSSSIEKRQLADTLASCERLKLLCQERKEQIAPLLEKFTRATERS